MKKGDKSLHVVAEGEYKIIKYDSEQEAEWHSKEMEREGWFQVSQNVFFSQPLSRRYEKRGIEGVFI